VAPRASIASRTPGNFVRREVVDDDDVIALERWHETTYARKVFPVMGPLSRTILVLAAVSSMNTSRVV
jgi:hypothetical protein